MMRIPLASYGIREMILGTALCLLGAVLSAWLVWWPVALLFVGLWIFLLAFFRDPERSCPDHEGQVLSPADGTVAEVRDVQNPSYLDEPAVKIGIFMSIFNCHVNRAPVSGTVEYTRRHPGAYYDARRPESAEENCRTEIGLAGDKGPAAVVNLIVGAVARRIVCAVEAGEQLRRGQRLGMIKFGSRVEVLLPRSQLKEVLAEPGMAVKAGRDVVAQLADEPSAPKPGA